MFDRLQQASKKFEESVSEQDQRQVKSPVFDACLKSYINYLHAKMRKASITPEDKVYEQRGILRNFWLKKDSILNKERERLLSKYEPSMKSGSKVLCLTYQLRENVQKVKNQCRSSELQEKVEKLEKDIRQLDEQARVSRDNRTYLLDVLYHIKMSQIGPGFLRRYRRK